MYLPKKEKRIFYTLLFIILLLTTSTTSLKYYLPAEIQKIIFSPSLSPERIVEGTSIQKMEDVLQVTRVIDGDTIELENGMKLRYIGIDTPETVDPRRPVQCFGKEASERNKELVAGKFVRLEKDVSETDRSGRLLRYVYVDDVMINEQLVREGYAIASSYPPDVKYQNVLQTAQSEARNNKRGLWDSCGIE